MKKSIIYITISLVVLILLGSAYKIFFASSDMNYSIILDKKKVSGATELTVYHGGEEKKVTVPDSLKIEAAPAYKIEVKRKNVVSIEPVKYYSGKILSINGNDISLENNVIHTTKSTKYYKVEGTSIKEISDKSLLTGYQGYRFIMDTKDNVKMVLCSIPKVNRIRTLISNSDYTTINHSEIRFSFNSEAELKSKDVNYKFSPNDQLIASKENKSIKLSLVKGSSTQAIGTTSSRIEIIQGDSTKISIPTNARKNNYIPSYYGSFELTLNDNGIKLINETYINNYLKGVVASEMPTSGGVEGFKIQAVTSRTAAIYSILSGKYASLGAHTIDSSASQLYEASLSNSQSDEAVEATSGEILTDNNDVIDAKFYSTSPGFTANYEDVFGVVTPSKDYLSSISLDESGNKINLSNEESVSQYLKDWTVKSFDSNSPLFRWKYSIDYSDLSKVINNNIYDIYTKNPKDFKENWHFFIYQDAKIPKEGIGKVKDIRVSGRNSSGIVTEVTIESDINTFKIKGIQNLSKLLIPKDGAELSTIYGKPIPGVTTLPSSFFTIEKNMSGEKFKSITIYGGGEGHGVGLSKYGAIGLSRKNKSYQDVLVYFYPGTKISNIDKEFRLEVENRKL